MIARFAIKSLVRRCTRSDIGRIVITRAIRYLKITFLKNGLVASYVENQVGARPAAYIPLITSVDLMCILELPGRCYPLPIEFISLRCSCESLLSLYSNLLLINLPQSESWFIQQQKSVPFFACLSSRKLAVQLAYWKLMPRALATGAVSKDN